MSGESSNTDYHRLRDESAERRRRRFINAMWSSDELDSEPDTTLRDAWTGAMSLVEEQKRVRAAEQLANSWMLQNREFMDPSKPEELTSEEIEQLIEAELPKIELRIPDGTWLQTACSEAIRYILERRVAIGLEPETAYLSVMYLINCISKSNFAENDFKRIRVVAMASLVLASYREEKEFPLWKFRVYKYKYVFTDQTILNMTYAIVAQCNWERQVTNPFRFSHFFVKTFCNPDLLPDLVPKIEQILLSATRDVNIVCQRASIVTLAAIIHLVAEADAQRTAEVVANSLKNEASGIGLNDIDADLATVLQLIQQLPPSTERTEKSAGWFAETIYCLINCFRSD